MCEEILNPERVSYGIVMGTSIMIEGLEPYSEYSVYIVASNAFGNGTVESVDRVMTTESGKYQIYVEYIKVNNFANSWVVYR